MSIHAATASLPRARIGADTVLLLAPALLSENLCRLRAWLSLQATTKVAPVFGAGLYASPRIAVARPAVKATHQ
jgi:hypothetical protein